MYVKDYKLYYFNLLQDFKDITDDSEDVTEEETTEEVSDVNEADIYSDISSDPGVTSPLTSEELSEAFYKALSDYYSDYPYPVYDDSNIIRSINNLDRDSETTVTIEAASPSDALSFSTATDANYYLSDGSNVRTLEQQNTAYLLSIRNILLLWALMWLIVQITRFIRRSHSNYMGGGIE